jgi:hypothetical protein
MTNQTETSRLVAAKKHLPGDKITRHTRAFWHAELGSAELYEAIAWYARAAEPKNIIRLLEMQDGPVVSAEQAYRNEAAHRTLGALGAFRERFDETLACGCLLRFDEITYLVERWPCLTIRQWLPHAITVALAFRYHAHDDGIASPGQYGFFSACNRHFEQCFTCAQESIASAEIYRGEWERLRPELAAFRESAKAAFEAAVFGG